MFAKFLFGLFIALTMGMAVTTGTSQAFVALPNSYQSTAVSAVSASPYDVDLLPEVGYTLAQTLDITLDTTQLFEGAQLIIDALSSPYLLIAGLGLGVAILAAILKAVQTIRL